MAHDQIGEQRSTPDTGAEVDGRVRLRAMRDAGSDLLLLVDVNGRPTYVNAAVHKTMGYDPDELLAVNPLEYMHPADIDRMAERLTNVRTDEAEHGPALVRVRRRDGHWHWLEAIPTDRLDDPNIRAMVVNGRYVTDRTKAEEELALEKDRVRNLVDPIPDRE